MHLATPTNAILDALNNFLLEPLLFDSSYRQGFCTAAFMLLIVGAISRYLLGGLKPIRDYFKATKVPSTHAGPSSFNQLTGCVGKSLKFAIITTLTVAILTLLILA
jgi:hypothetical protein